MWSCVRATVIVVSVMVTAKCLPVLYVLVTLPTLTPIGPAPASCPALTWPVIGQAASRWRPAGPAACGPVGGQDRVAAGDQPLAGEVRRGGLGQVPLVGQGELERAVVCHQPADGRGAQRGDPLVRVRLLCPRRRPGSAANKWITDVLGTRTPGPSLNPVTMEMATAHRHPEMLGQRQEAERTVGITAPTASSVDFSAPSADQARYARTHSGRRRPAIVPRTAYVLVSGMDLE
jgi:hypothetical protein